MPNTKSAKKVVRSSLRKRQFNNFWKNRIKSSVKNIESTLKTGKVDADILKEELSVLQKALDKATKNNVIHRNKANRLKSRYANKIAALNKGTKTKGTAKTTKGKENKEEGTGAGSGSKS